MPYRRAHWWLLALFPLIGMAFWRGYWSQLGTAPFALHAHGITATVWLLLLMVQSWSVQTGRAHWHRAAGLATFVVLPLFAAAGPLALQGNALLWRTNADPFHATYGARLVVADMIAGPAVIAMVVYAFLHRRQVTVHASAMLATAILVLPPIIGRLFPFVPAFPSGGWFGLGGFRLAFHLGEAVALVLAIWLAAHTPAARPAFGFAAAATVAQMVGFETIGGSRLWERWVSLLTEIPSAQMAIAAAALAAGLLWWAWRKVPPYRTGDRAQSSLSQIAT